jgi:hypothetical protein
VSAVNAMSNFPLAQSVINRRLLRRCWTQPDLFEITIKLELVGVRKKDVPIMAGISTPKRRVSLRINSLHLYPLYTTYAGNG